MGTFVVMAEFQGGAAPDRKQRLDVSRRFLSEGRCGFAHGSAYFITQGRIGYSPRECDTARQKGQERNRLVTPSARTAFQTACDAVQDLSESLFEEGASLIVSP